ncbi:hypothetical protein I4U23_017288 [Adineta vaga]|nr:hypothetical protein I4U23_017288 [Adineta vaga]
MVFDVLSPLYLILASIDRIYITSLNALTRQRSTPRLAYFCIISTTLFCLLFHSHTLFLTEIFEAAPAYIICYFQLDTYLTFIGYYLILIRGILIPLILIILAIWTVRNVQNIGRVIPLPTSGTNGNQVTGHIHSSKSKDRQLIRILLCNVIIYIIFSTMISVVLIVQQVRQSENKSLALVRLQSLLVSVGMFSAYIPFCIDCYINLLISKTFRNEMKKIFKNN